MRSVSFFIVQFSQRKEVKVLYYNQYPQYGQQNIVKVNGENGARTFQLMPNSSALLLDETQPVVWLVQTDGAGYKTCTPYGIKPYEKPESDLELRVRRIEEMLNAKSNTSGNASCE